MPLKSLLLMIGAGWIMLGSYALGPGLIVYPLAWTAVAVSFWGLHCLLGERVSGVTANAVAATDLTPQHAAGGSSKASTV
ncbi:hypothetical protein [Blastopirellula marina]|uniref:Uncharacterized protein n=1 Tax=Blastopirellula marina DSM 3645 TaxID=314230 RepID=A3ZUQ1_9BACT|nr:hypothetical protein [Blastopirellula marina]EAQ79637.1 hypothetical protein DSM3645_24050 [Blastopirellula marina DSM 3645]